MICREMILPAISLPEKKKSIKAFPDYLCCRQIDPLDAFVLTGILTSGILRINVVLRIRVCIRGAVPMIAVEHGLLLPTYIEGRRNWGV